ncbi:hypothetical protein [Pseudomonas sp. B15(2017)]|uniref:hypothetical protein n=1 Tax=Pseudomonas sp. B15(2017) TaxID=1981744 RepID=UPI000A1FB07D|nr:hypothetical protein [Pseudomonas sp. B15(2017)]
MPAPDDLTAKTPGEPLGSITPLASAVTGAAGGTTDTNESKAAQAQPPLYVVKHIAGGRWRVVTNDDEAKPVGDFVGDKVTVQAELHRLLDGGEPLTLDPERLADKTALSEAKPAAASDIDASTLKQAVMTPDGWLCPEPPVKG